MPRIESDDSVELSPQNSKIKVTDMRIIKNMRNDYLRAIGKKNSYDSLDSENNINEPEN
jgi:flagellar biosynthesis component FlhA